LLRIKGSNGSNTKNNDSSEQLAQLKIKDKEVLTTDDIAALSTDKYIVTKGDNLYRIAVKNNIDVVKLKELNNLSDEKIIPGQILIVK
jgi:LysM repeat protein